jgi:hypothetical protein
MTKRSLTIFVCGMQEAKLKEKIESMFNGEHVCPQ